MKVIERESKSSANVCLSSATAHGKPRRKLPFVSIFSTNTCIDVHKFLFHSQNIIIIAFNQFIYATLEIQTITRKTPARSKIIETIFSVLCKISQRICVQTFPANSFDLCTRGRNVLPHYQFPNALSLKVFWGFIFHLRKLGHFECFGSVYLQPTGNSFELVIFC